VIEAERGLVFIHPFDDPRVIAGQGTIALELALQVPDLDAVVVPVGGGGLIGGVAVALKALKPAARITHEELLDHCKERLARFKYPRQVRILRELPKGPTGKVLRSELAKEEF